MYNDILNEPNSIVMESNLSGGHSVLTHCNTTEPWDAIKLSLVSALSLCACVSTVGNLLVIAAFCAEKKLRTNFNIFLLNLALTDLLVSLTAIPLYTIDYALCRWPFGQVMCGMWIFMDWGMTFASIFTLVAISVDRYWAACWGAHYRAHNSQRRTLVVIGCIWAALVVVWVPSFTRDRVLWSAPGVCIWSINHNRIFSVIVALFGYHGPSFLILGFYIKVVVTMWKLSKTIAQKRIQSLAISNRSDAVNPYPTGVTSQSQSSAVMPTSPPRSRSNTAASLAFGRSHCGVSLEPDPISEGVSSVSGSVTEGSMPGPHSIIRKAMKKKRVGISRREKKIFSSLSVIVIAYLVCWAPFHVLFDIMYFWPQLTKHHTFLEWYSFASWMCYMNSAVNPILYACANQDFRRAFWKLLTGGYFCKSVLKGTRG